MWAVDTLQPVTTAGTTVHTTEAKSKLFLQRGPSEETLKASATPTGGGMLPVLPSIPCICSRYATLVLISLMPTYYCP